MEAKEIIEIVVKINKELNINLTMIESMCIVANTELALRHPENNGPAAFIAKKTAERLINKILEVWPEMREHIEIMEAWGEVFDIN